MSEFLSPDDAASLPNREQGWSPPSKSLDDEASRLVTLPVYPLNLVELLDRACALYRRQFRSMIALSAAVYFVPGLIALRAFSTVLDDAATPFAFGNASSSPILGSAGSILDMIAIFLLGVAVAPVVAAAYEGRPTPSALWKPLVRRLPAAVAGVLLAHLLLIVALLLLAFSGWEEGVRVALNGFVVTVALFLAPFVLRMAPAMAIEGVGPYKAFRRSLGLARQNYFRSLAAISLGGLVFSLAGMALSFIPSAIFGALAVEGVPYMWVPLGLVNFATTAFVEPMVALVACMLYFDARIRREGYDVALLTERARDGG